MACLMAEDMFVSDDYGNESRTNLLETNNKF